MTLASVVRDLIAGLELNHERLLKAGVRDGEQRPRFGVILKSSRHREFVVRVRGGAYRVTVDRVSADDRGQLTP